MPRLRRWGKEGHDVSCPYKSRKTCGHETRENHLTRGVGRRYIRVGVASSQVANVYWDEFMVLNREGICR